jgi:hypothetical protein
MLASEEGACSILFIVETPGRRQPVVGVAGRLRADPHRAIGQISVMKQQLVKLASEQSDISDK